MSVAVAMEQASERPTGDRAIHCPDCGRYLAAATAGPLPVGVVWMRLNCRTCCRWHWYDAATGKRRDGGAP